MLAIQRPSMGSSKPPKLEMPFGYSFESTPSNFPFPSPTAPAPGPSLLDDNESKLLDSFFDGMSSDQFNYDFFNDVSAGGDMGIGWEDLPPTFMGTSSSYGQQPQLASHQAPSTLNFAEPDVQLNAEQSILPILPPESADVLAAAALLQNGLNGRSQSMIDGSQLSRREPRMTSAGSVIRAQSMPYPPPPRVQTVFQTGSNGEDFMRETFYTDMMFGDPSAARTRNRPMSQKVDIRWGSDATFTTPQSFIPPTQNSVTTAAERYHLQAVESALSMGATQTASSASTTRPSSPMVMRGTTPHQRTLSMGHNLEDEDPASRPRKRRRSNYQEDDEEEDEFQSSTSATSKSALRKRRAVKPEFHESQMAECESSLKRRKFSAGIAARATRENLTEEQKRENHIKSEQKRRTLIREGFDDLGDLVPGLRGGGFSKSAILIMAADWLEDLIQGNGILQARLDEMERR